MGVMLASPARHVHSKESFYEHRFSNKLCADKKAAFEEIYRVLRPGGWLQFADIANGNPVPESAMRNVDLWTA